MGQRIPYRPILILGLGLCLFPLSLVGQSSLDREIRHQDPQWASVQAHLPDPATATPKLLETEGDVLRARRFPEDALDYYNFAIQRGGVSASLLNKIGLTQLTLNNTSFAESYFRRVVKVDRRNAEGWNNLAATEHLNHRYDFAVGDYKHAIKLEKTNAIFRANLSTTYFEQKDYKNARRQATEALQLDPLVYERENGAGIAARVLSMEDRARFSYEMAKLYAQRGQEEDMLHSLSVASENGLDILALMAKDPNLSKYRKDPRVILLVTNAKTLHSGDTPSVLPEPESPQR
jgi:tetratricopeptide (TPR) repeat protein